MTSVGELVFDGKEPSLKPGDVVHFDKRGCQGFELTSLQGDLDRMMLVRYPHVTSVIDDETLRRLDLYDFQKERRDLDAGKAVHAA